MSCPYLKEVVMLFCDGYPVKKMLPLDKIASAHPCLGQFDHCPLFRELDVAPVPDCDREPAGGAAPMALQRRHS